MIKARKYVVTKHFQGVPKRDDFDIVEYELSELSDGEVLVKTEWISVDPYLRAINKNLQVPYDQSSYQVGVVIQSKNQQYPIGTRIVSHKGWCDYYILDSKPPTDVRDYYYALPKELEGLPSSLALGAVGRVGASAYFGLLEICKPKAGETLVVTGAAGAVGSLVGQIGKIKGCKVIGFAGTDEKAKWLEEIGFNKAFNYKTVNAYDALKEAAPEGIDCFFDNVGGELSSTVISLMNKDGRIAVCGSISTYNEDPMPKASIIQIDMVVKTLKMEGFMVNRWKDRFPESFSQMAAWVKEKKLIPREHIYDGFENVVEAFIGMLTGENFGKAVVKV